MRKAAAFLALVATGCATMQPSYVRPESAVPTSWPAGDAYLRQSEAALPAVTYRDVFRDARLQALIDQALVNNRDLAVAAANIAAAREQYRIQRAQQLPQLDAGAGTTLSGSGAGSGVDESYQAGLSIPNFDIDLFGRLRSLTDAQRNLYFATEAAARTTRLAMVSDIATTWLTYAADASLLRIAEDTVASAEKSVRLTRARLEGGVAPRTDLRQAEQILESAKADAAEQRTALAQDVNLLRLLVGAEIDPALLPAAIDQALPTLAQLPAGLDSRVLLRRPDVVQAEYELRSANAQIGAARAALFPRISLTGLLGLASTALGNLFSADSLAWSASGDATYSIFRGGAGRANVRLSEAQKDAAVAMYQRTIQQAFREVSDALARQGTIGEQLRARSAQREAAADSYQLIEARYRNGIESFLDSLVAQRAYYAAQQSLVLTQLQAGTNRVELYRTLGGDTLLAPPVTATEGP
jgi:multidrug efflux system outer membrane protein